MPKQDGVGTEKRRVGRALMFDTGQRLFFNPIKNAGDVKYLNKEIKMNTEDHSIDNPPKTKSDQA
jgi:hypothetical protein